MLLIKFSPVTQKPFYYYIGERPLRFRFIFFSKGINEQKGIAGLQYFESLTISKTILKLKIILIT